MGKKKKSKINIPLCAAAVLLCLTLVSIHMTSGLYARYSASASSEDSARVARFDVSAEISKTETITNSDRRGEYTLKVNNGSEVAIEYGVVLRFENLPEGLRAALDGETGSVEGESIVFSAKNRLSPDESSNYHQLIISLASGEWADITQTMSGLSDSVTLPFAVEITAQQLD